MNTPKLLMFAGSARRASFNQQLIHAAAAKAKQLVAPASPTSLCSTFSAYKSPKSISCLDNHRVEQRNPS
ncbi:MAG: hypothetical protein QM477_11580 [Planctomycetota bacterium]